MKIVPLPEGWLSHLLVVRDVEDAESWFLQEELATARAFHLEKRRREWMLSRIAEKELRRRGARGKDFCALHLAGR